MIDGLNYQSISCINEEYITITIGKLDFRVIGEIFYEQMQRMRVL